MALPGNLSASQFAAFKELYDFKTQFCKAARQILDSAGIEATGPGEGTEKVPRYYSSVDFERGGATGPDSYAPIPLDLGAGAWRTSLYAVFEGTLTVLFAVPYEEDQKSGEAYLTEDHARTLDELDAAALVLFADGLQPFTAALLPNLDVQMAMPIEPDERPEEMREVNVRQARFRVRFAIRQSAWPTS